MDLMDATANQGSTGNTCTMYHARSPPITGSRPRRRVRNLGLLKGCVRWCAPCCRWRARKVDDRPSRQSRGQASLRYGFSRFVVCCLLWLTLMGLDQNASWIQKLEKLIDRPWTSFCKNKSVMSFSSYSTDSSHRWLQMAERETTGAGCSDSRRDLPLMCVRFADRMKEV